MRCLWLQERGEAKRHLTANWHGAAAESCREPRSHACPPMRKCEAVMAHALEAPAQTIMQYNGMLGLRPYLAMDP